MDFDDAADELYGVSPSAFVERRTALARDARTSGDPALAQSIRQLRKPSVSAWVINRLARDEKDRVAQLLDVGVQLRAAQERLAGAELRRLSQDGRALVERLGDQAAAVAEGAGQKPSAATLGEVEATLQAALFDGAAGEQVAQGRLTVPLAYSGFGPLPEKAPPPPARRAASPDRSQEAARRATERLEALRREHDHAQARHEETEKRVRGLEADLRAARAELAAAERALQGAERRLEQARRGSGPDR